MALYTGVNAILKVPGAEEEVLVRVPFYKEDKWDVEFDESKGGYPKFDFILDYLDIEGEIEESDETYDFYHKRYRAIIDQKALIVEKIEQQGLVEKFKEKELAFITRNYPLAEFLQKALESGAFYFRKIVDPKKLAEILTQCEEEFGIGFDYVIKEIQDLKEDYFFEVHVS